MILGYFNMKWYLDLKDDLSIHNNMGICYPLQKNHPSRAGTHWTAQKSRKRRPGPYGSRWLYRNRRASESSSRTGTSVKAKERPKWQKSKLERKTV